MLFTIIIVLVVALVIIAVIVNAVQQHKERLAALKRAEFSKLRSLLEDTEEIKKFYSEHTNEIAGNFFTNKRLAKYWIDKGDSSKNVISSAFYGDIITIDTVYDAGLTYCPYLLITKKMK